MPRLDYDSAQRLLQLHNYAHQISVVWPGKPISLLECPQFEIKASLQDLIYFIHQLPSDTLKQLKMVSSTDISHENSICMVDGVLTLKLEEESYHRSGFKFSKSRFSHGNKKFVNQMWIHTFDLLNSSGDYNDTRLLWYAANADKRVYTFWITGETDEAIQAIQNSGMNVKTNKIAPHISSVNIDLPNLNINDDQDDQEDILRWLKKELPLLETHSHHQGDHDDDGDADMENVSEDDLVDTALDPYSLHVDVEEPIEVFSNSDVNIVNLSSNNGIISNSYKLQLINQIRQLNPSSWFGLVTFGHKSVLKSFGTKGEHGWLSNGKNDLFVFVSKDDALIWKDCDKGDPK